MFFPFPPYSVNVWPKVHLYKPPTLLPFWLTVTGPSHLALGNNAFSNKFLSSLQCLLPSWAPISIVTLALPLTCRTNGSAIPWQLIQFVGSALPTMYRWCILLLPCRHMQLFWRTFPPSSNHAISWPLPGTASSTLLSPRVCQHCLSGECLETARRELDLMLQMGILITKRNTKSSQAIGDPMVITGR